MVAGYFSDYRFRLLKRHMNLPVFHDYPLHQGSPREGIQGSYVIA